MFFPKLAYDNLHKNARDEFPFIFATAVIIILNLVCGLIQNNPTLINNHYRVVSVIRFGTVVIAFFSVIFLIYTHNFLLQRKTKTYGLYYLLGMSKTDLYKLSFWEKLFDLFFGLIFGIVGGIFFAKILNLLLMRLIGNINAENFNLKITILPIILVSVFLIILFLFLLIINMIKIKMSSAINLLKSENAGEKMPKNHWLLAIVGVITLGVGYYLALTNHDIEKSIKIFFTAAILVIIGTYLLFITGSVTFLKYFKNKEKIYYRPQNFISISQMIFRMKQNGVGLANISILITMTLVTIVMTSGLFFGFKEFNQRLYPRDLKVSATYNQAGLKKLVASHAKKNKINVKNEVTYQESMSINVHLTKNELSFQKNNNNGIYTEVNFISQQEYLKLGNPNYHLKKNQILIFASNDELKNDLPQKNMKIRNVNYQIVDLLPTVKNHPTIGQLNYLLIVVHDQNIIKHTIYINDFPYAVNSSVIMTTMLFDTDATAQNKDKFVTGIRHTPDGSSIYVTADSREYSTAEMQSMSGTLLFVGILTSIIFIISTALIIYYKQITEGYNDQKNFVILQKVGLAQHEVKKIVNGQIIWVFFLPISVALIHLSVASPLIFEILRMLGLSNRLSLLKIAAVTILIILTSYLIIYRLTSKVYVKIVEK